MPRTATKLVKLREACATLGCSRRTFWEKWHQHFTDPRPKADRRPGCERRVYDDELAVAVEEANKGPAAIYTFRKLMKRL